jgi:ATP-dependent helicase/nuclease subunit B
MRLAAIPSRVPFLDALAERWLLQFADDPSRGLILLPTRRAARALVEAFLRARFGRPMLLPRVMALGALDEAPLELAGALDLPPAVAPARRLAVLSRLILALPPAEGGARTAEAAWRLAGELAALMDEAERAEIDLPEALEHAADGEYAQHWRITLRFLGIVTRAWPAWLAEQGLMNPASRQVALLAAQARAWRNAPPAEPVWVAGTTGGIKAVAALLRVVAGLPNGLVVLPGLDHTLGEAAWDHLDDTHPQATLRRLLDELGATRGDVETWQSGAAVPAGREKLLSVALLPARALEAWRVPAAIEPGDLLRLAPADQQEEAVAIALILRDALETPGASAALITPDRALAGRVAAELLRWGVVADDSAGEKLADTPPAVFLRLLARAVAGGLAPVPLLALLKHPLAAAGLAPAACRNAARALELAALRGPRPEPGLNGLRRRAVERDAPPQAHDLLARLETCLAPMLRVAASLAARPADALGALIESAESLAATDALPGPARLWALEEGEALAAHLAEVGAALAELPEQPPATLPGLLEALLEGPVVRSRRAQRGRDGVAEHPRVFIWGLLEARLQAVDVAVLGGLVEGVWPLATDPGPWMSRPMRARAGLPSPEERIGQSAHDFVAACCSAPRVVLSCPRRRDGAPAVPARWLARLDAYLAGQGRKLALHPAAAWAGMLDQPLGGVPRPVPPPEPRPPLRLRPRRLAVSEIETWLADPYAIYARHVLGLVPLDPLEQSTDATDYGLLVHRGLDQFLKQVGAAWPANARALLREAMDHALREAGVRQALFEWWAPRLARIADWVAEQETRRRSELAPIRIDSEVGGRCDLAVPGGFTLRGRADRIEKHADGSLAILDYKTGQPPSQQQVEAGYAPQLPLEAAMAEAGGFGPALRAPAAELTYWHLTGGFEPGAVRTLCKGDREAIAELVAEARARLGALIVAFDRVERAYLARPHPGRVPRFPQYAQLARLAEWDLSGGDAS